MDLQFIPRAELRERLVSGWALIPGHSYNPADYAILMMGPCAGHKLSVQEINRIEARFSRKPRRGFNNKSNAVISRFEANGKRKLMAFAGAE